MEINAKWVSPPFRLGPCLVDPRFGRLSCDGKVVHLRPQLIDLLVCLARNAGRVVLKEEILDVVWRGRLVAESGLTRCIAELRDVLQPYSVSIKTVPKRGYCLVVPVACASAGPGPDAGASLPVALSSPAPLPRGPDLGEC
jgi:DNA-binding winged helix-turn-helix (wHTH) protein